MQTGQLTLSRWGSRALWAQNLQLLLHPVFSAITLSNLGPALENAAKVRTRVREARGPRVMGTRGVKNRQACRVQ
jgi:hypothetical protein